MIEKTMMHPEASHAADAPSDSARPRPNDSSRLMVLVVVITTGALIVVAALLGAAAIGTPWALAALMAVHLATTTVVFVVVVYVLFGRLRLPQRRDRVLRPRRHP